MGGYPHNKSMDFRQAAVVVFPEKMADDLMAGLKSELAKLGASMEPLEVKSEIEQEQMQS